MRGEGASATQHGRAPRHAGDPPTALRGGGGCRPLSEMDRRLALCVSTLLQQLRPGRTGGLGLQGREALSALG